MKERRWLAIGVVIPVLGIAALIARAELKSRAGETFRVDITGFDPRDLLHGHYLQYRYDWDLPGAGECVCLTRHGSPPATPSAHRVECDDVAACDAWLAESEVAPPRRYFIPEEKAERLERAFFSRRPQVDLTIRADGRASVGELYLDGKPWREVVP